MEDRKISASQMARVQSYVGRYHHVLCKKDRNHGIPHADMELGFNYNTQAEKVLQAIKAAFSPKEFHYYNYEIRCTGSDDALISVAHDQDVLWVDFQSKARVGRQHFEGFCHVLESFGYRKHWAKGMETENIGMVQEQFRYLGDFLNWVKLLDPEGKLQNKHNKKWFQTISGCAPVKQQEAMIVFLDNFFE